MIGRLIAVLLWIIPAAPLSASAFSGNELSKYCSDRSDLANQLGCLMYLQGFAAGIEAGDGSKPKDKRIWCFPDGVTVTQSRLIVEKYMRDNPQILHQPAGFILGLALMEAFPCKN